MSEQEIPEYMAGGTSPISGVTHLFSREQVRECGGALAPKAEAPAESVPSICGAVHSYGPFRSTDEADGEVCKNCERVREQRETTEEDD